MTKIVVLDGYVLNPGDLSWDGFAELGDLTVYDRTPPGMEISRSEDADMLITNKTPLPRATIEALPRLKYIGALSTGYNVIDTVAAAERGIPVTNVPKYGTQAVAQMVFAHILNLTNRVAEHGHGVADGKWTRAKDFCYWDFPLRELSGRTLGIIGFGRTGAETAKIANAFGMDVLAYTPRPKKDAPEYVRFTDIATVFREGDFVSLHCPLTPGNRRFVNAELIGTMKRDAYFVNTARGQLVDEAALADALNSGRIAGAGLDVLETEPPRPECPLVGARNCVITPHIAWAALEARRRLMDTAVANARAFLRGERLNVVNLD